MPARAASSSFSDAEVFSSSRASQIAACVSSRSGSILGHRTSGPYFLSSRSAHSGSAGSVRSTPGGTNVMSFSAPQSGGRPSLVAYGLGGGGVVGWGGGGGGAPPRRPRAGAPGSGPPETPPFGALPCPLARFRSRH